MLPAIAGMTDAHYYPQLFSIEMGILQTLLPVLTWIHNPSDLTQHPK
jgi:hypothetical protein